MNIGIAIRHHITVLANIRNIGDLILLAAPSKKIPKTPGWPKGHFGRLFLGFYAYLLVFDGSAYPYRSSNRSTIRLASASDRLRAMRSSLTATIFLPCLSSSRSLSSSSGDSSSP